MLCWQCILNIGPLGSRVKATCSMQTSWSSLSVLLSLSVIPFSVFTKSSEAVYRIYLQNLCIKFSISSPLSTLPYVIPEHMCIVSHSFQFGWTGRTEANVGGRSVQTIAGHS